MTRTGSVSFTRKIRLVRTTTWFLAIFVIAMYHGQLVAQEPVDSRAADHQALIQLKAKVEQAMSSDISLLKDHLSDDFSVVTFSSREFDDFEVFVREWNKSREKFLRGGNFSVELIPEKTKFVGETAICRGNSKNVIVQGNGKRYEFSSPWTAICRKEGDQWKMIRGHSSIDPFRNPMVTETVSRLGWLIGGGSFLTGLVFGFIICRWIRKKPTA